MRSEFLFTERAQYLFIRLLITLFALGGFIMHCSDSRFAKEWSGWNCPKSDVILNSPDLRFFEP